MSIDESIARLKKRIQACVQSQYDRSTPRAAATQLRRIEKALEKELRELEARKTINDPVSSVPEKGERESVMSAFALKASSGGGGDFELAPAGNHPAVLIGIIDLGTQETKYGNEIESSHRVMLVWELTTEKKENGENFVVGRDYNLSSNPKANLRLMLEKWRGKAYTEGEPMELEKIVGKPCLLSIVHGKSNSGKDYARVEGATQLPKGMTVAPASRKPVCWEIGMPLQSLPSWVPYYYGREPQKVIQDSEEFKAGGRAPSTAGGGSNGATANQEEEIMF